MEPVIVRSLPVLAVTWKMTMAESEARWQVIRMGKVVPNTVPSSTFITPSPTVAG